MNKQVKLTSQILGIPEDTVEKNIRTFYEFVFESIRDAQISNEEYKNIKIPRFGKFAIKPNRLKNKKHIDFELKIKKQNLSGF